MQIEIREKYAYLPAGTANYVPKAQAWMPERASYAHGCGYEREERDCSACRERRSNIIEDHYLDKWVILRSVPVYSWESNK